MIGRNGERRSGISALAARHDDDDDVLNTTNILRSSHPDLRCTNHLVFEEPQLKSLYSNIVKSTKDGVNCNDAENEEEKIQASLD